MITSRWAKILLLLSAAAGLSCSGGKDGEPPLAGRAAAGDARIWLDLNGNIEPDPGEPTGRTAASGEYLLRPPPQVAVDHITVVVQVEAGRSILTDGRLAPQTYLLLAPADSREVSVWTTLMVALVAGGQAVGLEEAQEEVRAAFALPDNFHFAGEPPPRERKIEGLGQIVQSAFGQKAARRSLYPEAEAASAVAAAAREVIDIAPLLLEVAAEQSASPEPPLPKSPGPVETGVFHGDFAALPIHANMAYGIGLDEASYELKGECTQEPNRFDGLCTNDSTYTFDLVETVHELSRHLAVGASASAGVSVAGFDVVEVSGGFDFLRHTEFKDNALYILLRVEHKICGYPAAIALRPPWADLYGSDYAQFRQTCGDRYLSSITSGGSFAALVEVEADENTKMEEMRLQLAGKVLGATVYNKTWKETLSEIDRDYTTHTRVLSSLFTYSDHLLGLSEVFARYDEFAAQMKRPACSGPDGWRDCGYLATFSPYEVISDRPPGNAAAVRSGLANMRALEAYYFEIADLLADIDEILLRPGDYNLGQSVDAFTDPNDWTLEGLMSWQDEVKQKQWSATRQWDSCRKNIQTCTDPNDLGLPSWLDLKMALPTRKFHFPERCADLAEQFGVTDDGERRLFLGGEVSRPYRVYCGDMASSAPRTYLKLFNRSAGTAASSYNYSTFHYSAQDGGSGVVTRIFEALLVEPRTDPLDGKQYLRILSGQDAHTEWSTTPTLEGESLAGSLGVLQAQGQGGATATANLNVEGTPFRVSPSLAMEGGGPYTRLSCAVTAAGKEIAVTVTGGTAAVKGELLLEWEETAE